MCLLRVHQDLDSDSDFVAQAGLRLESLDNQNLLHYVIQNPFQAESKPFKTNCRAQYCDVKGWQYYASINPLLSSSVVRWSFCSES